MTAHIIVLGFVQGVGFRRFIKNKAQNLSLTGYVKNLPDGRVEVLAQGSKEKIEELVKVTEKGNWFSDIKDVVIDWEKEMENFSEFSIIK